MEKEIAKNDGAKVLNRFCKLFVGIVNGDGFLEFGHETRINRFAALLAGFKIRPQG